MAHSDHMHMAKRCRSLILLSVLASLTFAALPGDKMASLQELSKSDPSDRLLDERLESLSSPGSGQTIDCGSTTMHKLEDKVSTCGAAAFENRKPFHLLYSGPVGYFHCAYGLAGDGEGNIYEVLYDSRGLLHLSLGKKALVFDGNRIRVTTCIKPIRLGRDHQGRVISWISLALPDKGPDVERILQKPLEISIRVGRAKFHLDFVP